MLEEIIKKDRRLNKTDVEVLCYISEHQCTQREAAKVFGVSQAMIMVRLKRIRTKIRKLYKL